MESEPEDMATDELRREELALQSLLAIAGPREPDDLVTARVVRRVLDDSPKPRQLRWGLAPMALAASFAAALGLAIVFSQSQGPESTAAQGSLATAEFLLGVPLVRSGDGTSSALSEGDLLRAGTSIRVPADGGVRLRYRGADVRIGPASEVLVAATRLTLDQGSIYVDTGTLGAALGRPIVVATPHGTVTHRGTQFIVRSEDDGMNAAVREGAIYVRTLTGQRLDAETVSATGRQIDVASNGHVSERPVARHAGIWSQALALAPPLRIDRRNAYETIGEASRELGLRIEWADANVRSAARASQLRASAPVAAELALDIVDAATELELTRPEPGVLRVRFD